MVSSHRFAEQGPFVAYFRTLYLLIQVVGNKDSPATHRHRKGILPHLKALPESGPPRCFREWLSSQLQTFLQRAYHKQHRKGVGRPPVGLGTLYPKGWYTLWCTMEWDTPAGPILEGEGPRRTLLLRSHDGQFPNEYSDYEVGLPVEISTANTVKRHKKNSRLWQLSVQLAKRVAMLLREIMEQPKTAHHRVTCHFLSLHRLVQNTFRVQVAESTEPDTVDRYTQFRY